MALLRALELGNELLSLFISTTGHNNTCPFLSKGYCGSATDAGQRASNQTTGELMHYLH